MRLLLFFTFIIALSLPGHGQNFASPIEHEIKLAGTFGELRTNHFHMGVDIKSSRGRYPDAILAAADGYVSRIKVSRSGYGNALYIDHPSGHTTVYGHLKYFNEAIDSVVNHVQLDSQSFEIDYYPDSTQIRVKKGDEIAKMGNSGSSYGPHLHFEIRDTKSEAPLNPMRFGIKPKDNTPAIISKIKFNYLNDKHQEINSKTVSPISIGKGRYTLPPQKLGTWRTGISVGAYDPMNDFYNKNGVYRIELNVDDSLVYEVSFDSISFGDTRYINAHIDYPHYKQRRSRLHRCFKLSGNKLPNTFSNGAIFTLYKDNPRSVVLSVYDFEENKSSIEFEVYRDSVIDATKPLVYNFLIPREEENMIKENDLSLYFPSAALYEDLYLYITRSPSEYLTDVFHIGRNTIPLHKAISVEISGGSIPVEMRDKVCLIECSNSIHISTFGGEWSENQFKAEIFSFGNYALALDTIPPTIKALQSGKDYSNLSKISFEIEDNFSESGTAKGLDYQAYIDDHWVKFAYDLKSKRISHVFDMPPTSSTHQLKLIVKDDRGNERILEKKFIR